MSLLNGSRTSSPNFFFPGDLDGFLEKRKEAIVNAMKEKVRTVEIFIYRENYHIIPGNLQSLLKTLNDLIVQILVHPLSAHELEKDRNQERRAITLSKIKTYPLLDNPPPLKSDHQFLTFVGQTNNAHEFVDKTCYIVFIKMQLIFR
jgi:hypothetical protein